MAEFHNVKLKKPKKAPEAMMPHPAHMKGNITDKSYAGKAVEPVGKTYGHGHKEH